MFGFQKKRSFGKEYDFDIRSGKSEYLKNRWDNNNPQEVESLFFPKNYFKSPTRHFVIFTVFCIIFSLTGIFLFIYNGVGLEDADTPFYVLAIPHIVSVLLSYFILLKATSWTFSCQIKDFAGMRQQLLTCLALIAAVLVITFTYSFKGDEDIIVYLVGIPCFAGGIAVVLTFLQIDKARRTPISLEENPNNFNQVHDDTHRTVIPTGDAGLEFRPTSHGSAMWISDDKKNELTAFTGGATNKEEGYFKGLWLGGGFFHHKEGNLISIAPPGTGKGAALIIPNLLWKRNYKHSLVVFDPKGTNACITARHQKNCDKKVIIIDPMDLQTLNGATHGISRSSFNPLEYIGDDVYNGTGQIASLLLPDNPHSKDKYWENEARNLLQLILIYIVESKSFENEDKNLVKLYRLINRGDFVGLLVDINLDENLNEDAKGTAMGFAQLLKSSDKTFASIRSIAGAALSWLGNPRVQETLKKSDFKPDEIAQGNIALYLCIPIQNKEAYATYSRLIIGFCLRANAKPSSSQRAWVYYLLDEFPTMGIFPEVIEALAYSREYRMRIWLFSQSMSQLDTVYTADGRNQIVGNTTIFQTMNVTDRVTQEYVSHRIGNKTEEVKVSNNSSSYAKGESVGNSSSSGFQANGGSSSSSDGKSWTGTLGSSDSTTYHGIALLPPEQAELDPNIITMSNWGPMRLNKWQYWQEPTTDLSKFYHSIFNDGRADPNPNFVDRTAAVLPPPDSRTV